MTIKIDGIEAVSKKLRTLADFQQWAAVPMEQTTALVWDEISKAPPKSPGAFSRLATPRQKRAYWAKVRSGEITHREGMGYQRTNTLQRRWTSSIKKTADGVRGELGNNAPYVFFVQSDARQQPFHKASGWVTDKQALERTEPRIEAVWRAAIRRVIDQA
jgi:hypothetical protein